MTYTGRVKWFNNTKGFGFIIPEGGGEDIFVHYSQIKMAGFKKLDTNQLVQFELGESPKGRYAMNVDHAAA